MQIEVLRYKHPDYEVIVRTQDITYAWRKFAGRINYGRRTNPGLCAPTEYCTYTAKDECQLTLYNPTDEPAPELPAGRVWDGLWPVIYETCKYQIRLRFHDIDPEYAPVIRHARRDIEEGFFLDEYDSKSEKSLTGDIDFQNEPGVFKLEFAYHKHGTKRETYVSFDVVSPKLDTKNDYKSLLREVNEEYENVIYRYLSITLQQFSRGRMNNDATWMAAFQSVVDDYLKNIKRIIHNPHTQTVNYRTTSKAERIKRWTPRMEEKYGEVRKEGKLEEYYFEYDEAHSSHDTAENRFVKHTLQSVGKRLQRVIANVLDNAGRDLSERHRQMWAEYQATLRRLARHPFFRAIGRYEGMRQESMVLQSRTGYQQIYKDWLKLKRGIDLYNGAANIGTLQIWEIYELWCFVKMKKLVAEVMGIDPNRPAHESLITEPKGTLLNPFTNSSLEHVVMYRYPSADETDSEERRNQLRAHEGDTVTLHYQHTFNRTSGNDEYGMGINTATTEQRPDIVLNITKATGEVVLTYLYDAKYRVINDKRLDADFEEQDAQEREKLGGGDYPPTDAINQMHRYRDAIYYSKEHEPYRSKEVIGGYILFPGRGDDENITRRYYSVSIDSVNIGAFPLLPNSCGLLREHLSKLLMGYVTTDAHVEKAKPQRMLAYVTEEEKEEMSPADLVMIAKVRDDNHRQWTLNHKWYNIPMDKVKNTPWYLAKYVLLYINGEKTAGNLCRVVEGGHDVWTGDQLKNAGYPGSPSHKAYFMIRIKGLEETPAALRNRSFDVVHTPEPYKSKRGMAFILVRLKDLLAMAAEDF